MLVLDSSALIAILCDEPNADALMQDLASARQLAMCAGTLSEVLIVAARRGVRPELERMIEDLDIEIAPLTPASARRVADAYDVWGKGVHPAALNFGDCFAYALAKARGWPVLFVGDDFAKTDVVRGGI